MQFQLENLVNINGNMVLILKVARPKLGSLIMDMTKRWPTVNQPFFEVKKLSGPICTFALRVREGLFAKKGKMVSVLFSLLKISQTLAVPFEQHYKISIQAFAMLPYLPWCPFFKGHAALFSCAYLGSSVNTPYTIVATW